MKVVIVDSQNNKEMIEINPSDSIKDVKEKIKNKKGINSDDIILHINGVILEENDRIDDYDIEEGSFIIYMGKFRGGKTKYY